MRDFPLQNKRLQRVALPYMSVGICEVMNRASTFNMATFATVNQLNRQAYSSAGALFPLPTRLPFMGDLVGCGLLDSYTGSVNARFVAAYLSHALASHTVVPTELQRRRREQPDDPLVHVMLTAAARHRALHTGPWEQPELRSLITDWDMQQYAMCADAAFFQTCTLRSRGRGEPGDDKLFAQGRAKGLAPENYLCTLLEDAISFDGDADSLVKESGSRGIWFSASVAPSALELQRRQAVRRQSVTPRGMAPPARKSLLTDDELERKDAELQKHILEQHPFCLDVIVSGVGDSRAFGIARNPFTQATKSALDTARERVVPLSVDHKPLRTEEFRRIIQAGGVVDSEVGNMIDGNPYYNVSRSFGHWSMKNNTRASPVRQKLIALPRCTRWEMLEGDVLVLSNHSLYETRTSEETSVDEVAKLVGREVDRGQSAEQIAATLCDFAVRFGAEHSLQVMVAVAVNRTRAGASSGAEVAEESSPVLSEWVEAGPIYVEACRNLSDYREALQRDCVRCGLTVKELLRLRWERIKDILPQRHALPLMPYYGMECGTLQQTMDEEAQLYQHELLLPAVANADTHVSAEIRQQEEIRREEWFEKLASGLMTPRAGSSA